MEAVRRTYMNKKKLNHIKRDNLKVFSHFRFKNCTKKKTMIVMNENIFSELVKQKLL